jgi:parvulin-like peptidyl-prolyl isomerase
VLNPLSASELRVLNICYAISTVKEMQNRRRKAFASGTVKLISPMAKHLQYLTKRLRLASAMALGVLLVACTSNAPSQSSSVPPQTVAIVNGRPISSKLYEMYLKNGRAELGLDANTEEGRRKLDQLRAEIVSELIDRMLIAEEAEHRGLSIPPDKLVEAERKAIAELGGERSYDSYLAEHHLTRDEYQDVVRMQLYGEMIRSEINKTLSITADEIKAYYEARRGDHDFQQQERVTASHILIAARANLISRQLEREKGLTGEALKKSIRDEMGRRRQRAVEIRRRATAGSDFAALARQFSEDPGTRESGGALGTFGRASHPAAFDAAAFKLKPGAISDVVQTEYGFHVIKVSAHESTRTQPLAEATVEISRRLLGELEAKTLTDWLRSARQKGSISINGPFRFGALKNEFPAK